MDSRLAMLTNIVTSTAFANYRVSSFVIILTDITNKDTLYVSVSIRAIEFKNVSEWKSVLTGVRTMGDTQSTIPGTLRTSYNRCRLLAT